MLGWLDCESVPADFVGWETTGVEGAVWIGLVALVEAEDAAVEVAVCRTARRMPGSEIDSRDGVAKMVARAGTAVGTVCAALLAEPLPRSPFASSPTPAPMSNPRATPAAPSRSLMRGPAW